MTDAGARTINFDLRYPRKPAWARWHRPPQRRPVPVNLLLREFAESIGGGREPDYARRSGPDRR
jgi:hypothetical protein